MIDILSEILKRIKIAEKELSEAIVLGANINNFEDYQRMLGRREGLSESLTIIEEILSEDDEAE